MRKRPLRPDGAIPNLRRDGRIPSQIAIEILAMELLIQHAYAHDGYDDGKNLDNSEDVVLVMNQKSQEKIPTERIL